MNDLELGGNPLSNIIIGDAVWTLKEGEWKEFPVVPIQWPLLAWVNGYVNGPDVVEYLVAGDREEVNGIPVTVYRGGIEEMAAAFPGKMAGREFVDTGTSFAYWVDDCGALLRADVVGAEFDIVPPVPGYLPEIPLPPGA